MSLLSSSSLSYAFNLTSRHGFQRDFAAMLCFWIYHLLFVDCMLLIDIQKLFSEPMQTRNCVYHHDKLCLDNAVIKGISGGSFQSSECSLAACQKSTDDSINYESTVKTLNICVFLEYKADIK